MPDRATVSIHLFDRPEVSAFDAGPSGPMVRTEFGAGFVYCDPSLARQYAAALLIAADEADPPSQALDLNVAATLALATGNGGPT